MNEGHGEDGGPGCDNVVDSSGGGDDDNNNDCVSGSGDDDCVSGDGDGAAQPPFPMG